jgi:hypothetical protein
METSFQGSAVMKRTSVLMALVVVVGTIAVPVAGAVAQETDTEDGDAPTGNDSVSPGERLSGVVGVQEAEFEGEIETRAVEIEYESAANDSERAERVAERVERHRERLQELREDRAELREERREGDIGEGEYRARIAGLDAEIDATEARLNETNETARRLPAETLERNGVNVTAIRTLQEEADSLSGAEVSAIARSIAGNERGEVDVEVKIERRGGVVTVEVEREDGRTEVEVEREDDPENASQAVAYAEDHVRIAEERLADAESQVGENGSQDANESLVEARSHLEDARTALEDARAALEAGDEERAFELVEEASDYAEGAIDSAQDAREEARDADDDRGDREGEDRGDDRDDETETETETSGDDEEDDETETPEDDETDTPERTDRSQQDG